MIAVLLAWLSVAATCEERSDDAAEEALEEAFEAREQDRRDRWREARRKVRGCVARAETTWRGCMEPVDRLLRTDRLALVAEVAPIAGCSGEPRTVRRLHASPTSWRARAWRDRKLRPERRVRAAWRALRMEERTEALLADANADDPAWRSEAEAAIGDLLETLREHPHHPASGDAAWAVARLRRALGDDRAERDALLALLRYRPTSLHSAEARLRLAEVERAAARGEHALANYRYATTAPGASPLLRAQALLALGRLNYALGRYEEARDVARELLETAPTDPAVLPVIEEARHDLRRFEDPLGIGGRRGF